MPTHLRPLFDLLLALSLVAGCDPGGDDLATAESELAACGAAVTATGRVVTVAPSGGDDTASLQCALDLAAAAAGRTNVQLLAGTYRTDALQVTGFHGALRGAGAGATTIRNLDSPLETTYDFLSAPPSATNRWPVLLSFVDGEVAIGNLAIEIHGAAPSTGWSIFGLPTIHALAGAVYFLGDAVDARIADVRIEGEEAPEEPFGVNADNGIYFEGFLAPDFRAISGSFAVHDSTFRLVGSPVPAANVRDGRIVITGNRFEDVLLGGELVDVTDTAYRLADNQISAWLTGFYSYDACPTSTGECGMHGARIEIQSNVISGPYGALVDGTFDAATSCLVADNDLAAVTDLGVYLGPGTRGCKVVNVTPGATIVDQGTGNIVVTP